jgi:hypothetical protein
LRPRLDLDLAVRDEQMAVLEKGLLGLGYEPPEENTDYPLPEYLNSKLFVPRSDGLMPLHIHKHLINNIFFIIDNALSMDMERIWEQTELFKDYNYISMLKPEINIIYLCEHGLKHDFEQMVFLYEIEALIRHYQEILDWKKLVASAKDFGLARVVYYGLYFVKELLSADIPEEVIEALKPERFTLGEKIFVKNILSGNNRRYSSYPVYLAMRKGFSKKTLFLFRTFFPPGFAIKGCLSRLARSILA